MDTTMLAARLHGPADLRVEEMPHPGSPGPGQALLRVTAVRVCGSDLHTYQDTWIGDTALQAALILGPEFAGVVEAVGSGRTGRLLSALHTGARGGGPGSALRPLRSVPSGPCSEG
jgi:L-iditol 2-dehydrogenase